MNKVIKKSNAVTLMANPKIELEVKYTNRPEFQAIMDDMRKNKTDMIMMPRVADLSRDPVDVKAACKEIIGMKKDVQFTADKLMGKDILKMSDDEILKITMATLEDDMVIIVDTPEIAMEMISKSKNNNEMTLK